MSAIKDKINGRAGNSLAFHNYSATAAPDDVTPMDTTKAGKLRRPLNTTPTKLPPAKKLAQNTETTPCNEVVVESTEYSFGDMVKILMKVESKVDSFSETLRDQSNMFTELIQRVEENGKAVAACLSRVDTLEKDCNDLRKENATLKEKVLDVERYKRRWNLRLSGLKEQEGENIREKIEELLLKIFPQWADNIGNVVDSVHRVGRKEIGRSRQVIMQFVRRIHRDALWKSTKDSPICKERGVRFVQDFTKEDLLSREQLWPKIKLARSQGKMAFYKGHIAVIDGRIVTA
ncbi:unnamed protein product [Knipowitschia caucasica]